MRSLRADLREIGEALTVGYERRSDEDPSLTGTVVSGALLGTLASGTIVSLNRLRNTSSEGRFPAAPVLLAVLSVPAALKFKGEIHDFADSMRRAQSDVF